MAQNLSQIKPTGAGGITYVRKTSAYTAKDKEGVIADTTGGAFTVTLPATPALGATVTIVDGGAWGTNNLTVGRNGSTIDGASENLVLDITGSAVDFIYDGTTWQVYAQVGAASGEAVTATSTTTLTNKTLIIGPRSVSVSTSANYTIIGYDSNATYTLSAPTGTVTRLGDTITYTAPASAGNAGFSVNGSFVNVTITPAGVQTPTNSSPANAATNQSSSVALSASAFQWAGQSTTHLKSDWQVATDSGFTNIVTQSLNDTTNKTSWTTGDLSVSTTYYWRVRYYGANGTTSAWSTATTFTTKAQFVPTTPGEAYEGGYYAGQMNIDGTTYAIVVAPKASGHNTSKQWATSYQAMGTTGSLYNGWNNTSQNNTATYPAFQWARSLSIGGKSDWYIPSRDELELCYRNLKPTTTSNTVYASRTATLGTGNGSDTQGNGDNDNSVPTGTAYTSSVPAQTANTAFQQGGAECFESQYYWSSSWFDSTSAWFQLFSVGSQDTSVQTNSLYVRAVRRVAI